MYSLTWSATHTVAACQRQAFAERCISMRTRQCLALIAAALLGAAVLGTPPADAATATLQASATVSHPVQYLDDGVGKPFYLTVHSTGAPARSVYVTTPVGWTAVACPTAPSGWSRKLTAIGCRYSSAAPLQTGVFRVDARSAPGRDNLFGDWRVRLWPSSTFTGTPIAATTSRLGLRTEAGTIEVTRVVVASGAARAPGSPCPAPARSAHAVADFWLCGINHSTALKTLYGPDSTFLRGTFANANGENVQTAPVKPGPASVVLGTLPDVPITGAIGQESSLTALYGSFATFLPHYYARNATPDATDVTSSAPAGTTTSLQLTGSDGDRDPLTFETIGAPAHGTLGTPGPLTCTSTCAVTIDYTPDPGYTGADSFAYLVNDGYVDSTAAVVRVTIT
jgi:hypothetical protein